ncbi:MAG: glycosyltransferase [Candidatus Dadabacteria bacterium]|nr:MAG: glycosyltransferase [Candidatus Dadabacteria bacterium]
MFQTLSASRSTDLFLVNWSINGLAAYIAKKITRKPYILVLRGRDIQLLKAKFIKFLLSAVFKNASFIISVNKGFIDKIKEDFSISQDKLAVIENGVSIYLPKEEEVKEFLKQEGLEEGRYIAFVGTVVPRKGVELLLELIGCINYRLLIAGRIASEGYYSKLLERVKELGVGSRVVFKGAVSPFKVSFYLAVSRYYISFSNFEGRPNALMEALAAKKVVIASDIEAHREVIKDGETGFLVSRDLEGVRKAKEIIERLDSDNREYLKVSEAAFKWARRFSWERSAKKYIEVFKKVLGSDLAESR